MKYEELRQHCIKMWNFYPETKQSISEMWGEINSHPGWRKSVAKPSAVMLLGILAEFADNHKEK